MDTETINQYKDYYYDQMIKHEWRYCTAFYLTKRESNQYGIYVNKSLTEQASRDFIHGAFSDIKRRLLVRNEKGSKYGIPFYAYYLICKSGLDEAYHAHVIMNIPGQYESSVSNYIEIVTGKKLIKLVTFLDVKRQISYMLKRGNFMVDSDSEYLLPTPYNLGVSRKHFKN